MSWQCLEREDRQKVARRMLVLHFTLQKVTMLQLDKVIDRSKQDTWTDSRHLGYVRTQLWVKSISHAPIEDKAFGWCRHGRIENQSRLVPAAPEAHCSVLRNQKLGSSPRCCEIQFACQISLCVRLVQHL